ncbi:cupin domain-containing protein [Streptomyces tagetis]|uniref:Cupin domain-containing protein n=1 Tax=Streptomyces tagetis TaxID=2820809 RepID=A0A940XE26_9ACTN|nr:cupin domain-containing protein [Streptomyces sp. RG38]MBQ0826546.1 cupin domain-containing protein [Streptomyces sp. RG38]
MIIIPGRAPQEARPRTDTFAGTVWTDPVLPTTDGVTVNQVFFTPGSRTHWHRHEHGQILLVTAGGGRIQSRGGPVRPLRVGDTVWVPPGEIHWHGGGEDSFLVHLAISLGTTEWMEPVDAAQETPAATDTTDTTDTTAAADDTETGATDPTPTPTPEGAQTS